MTIVEGTRIEMNEAAEPAESGGGFDIAAVRAALAAVADAKHPRVSLVAVANHKAARRSLFEMPLSNELAYDLGQRAQELSNRARAAELVGWHPAFIPEEHQFLLHSPGDAELIVSLEDQLASNTAQPYSPANVALGRQTNLLVIRLYSHDGTKFLGSCYQSTGSAETLKKRRLDTMIWSGAEFTRIEQQALILKPLELVVTPQRSVVAASANAYATVSGPLPELEVNAAETFDSALRPLGINNAEQFEQACLSDRRMMAKLLSIREKMAAPEYADKMRKDKLIAFVKANPYVNVDITTVDGQESIAYDSDPQKRWAILKLVDDSYLTSTLTDYNYEANSKQII
jgi:hypothetical protein